ncbi:21113_t:CDS:1, partial [Gigaspora margarita]
MSAQSKENFVPKFEYITHVEKFFDYYLKQDKTIFQKYNNDLIYIYDTKEETYDFFGLLDICWYNKEKIIYDNLIINFCSICDE